MLYRIKRRTSSSCVCQHVNFCDPEISRLSSHGNPVLCPPSARNMPSFHARCTPLVVVAATVLSLHPWGSVLCTGSWLLVVASKPWHRRLRDNVLIHRCGTSTLWDLRSCFPQSAEFLSISRELFRHLRSVKILSLKLSRKLTCISVCASP